MDKEKNKDLFQETIKAYLDKRAQEDSLFATSYAKENKSIEECCKFIMQEVKKTGRCGFCDEEIYGLAVHYYDEDNLGKITGADGTVVVNTKIELSEEEKAELKQRAEEEYKQECVSALRKKEAEAKKRVEEKRKELETKVSNNPSLFD